MDRRTFLQWAGIAPVAAAVTVAPLQASAASDADLAQALRGLAKTQERKGYEATGLTLRRAAHRLDQVNGLSPVIASVDVQADGKVEVWHTLGNKYDWYRVEVVQVKPWGDQ